MLENHGLRTNESAIHEGKRIAISRFKEKKCRSRYHENTLYHLQASGIKGDKRTETNRDFFRSLFEARYSTD